MKTHLDVSADKLRGGFYTPAPLVDLCLARTDRLSDDRSELRVLEPSAGDGAFLRGIARGFRDRAVSDVCAVELVPEEARKAEVTLRSLELPGRVHTTSILSWAVDTNDWFDVVVGNPPFVRYQFISQDDRAAIVRLGARLGIEFAGVSNLWQPVLVAALSRLRPGGAVAAVVPTECFTGCAARAVRDWLTREFDDLRFDLFPPMSFPGVLQEVSVVSGRRRPRPSSGSAEMTIAEHGQASERQWTYLARPGEKSWMRSLLDPAHLDALDSALRLPTVTHVGDHAQLEVSIVTGANDYFCVSEAVAREFELEPWVRPLLPRARHAPGLVYTPDDATRTRLAGSRCWILDFADRLPDPRAFAKPTEYLAHGERRSLHRRYKCRIREPWYRVPSIRTGTLMLSKRCHLHPRLLLNAAGSYTTDTIYRGTIRPAASVSASDLVAGFHSSLTLLSAELEGRSFGGGVLELVPSEIARLAVAVAPGVGSALAELDRAARSVDPNDVISKTDAHLAQMGLLDRELLDVLGDAREALLSRRLNRGQRVKLDDAPVRQAA